MTTLTPSASAASDRERVLVGVSCMDDEGRARGACEGDLCPERALLVVPGGVLAVVVEPRLADRDAARVRRQRLQLGQVGVVEAARLVGVTADRRIHLGERLGRRERGAARDAVGADGEQLHDARRHRALDELGVWLFAQVQVGVAVDHALR